MYQLKPSFKVPQRSNAPNKKAIKTKSQAFWLIAQGAKKISPIPCRAAPIPKWSKTKRLWDIKNNPLAKYLKKVW